MLLRAKCLAIDRATYSHPGCRGPEAMRWFRLCLISMITRYVWLLQSYNMLIHLLKRDQRTANGAPHELPAGEDLVPPTTSFWKDDSESSVSVSSLLHDAPDSLYITPASAPNAVDSTLPSAAVAVDRDVSELPLGVYTAGSACTTKDQSQPTWQSPLSGLTDSIQWPPLLGENPLSNSSNPTEQLPEAGAGYSWTSLTSTPGASQTWPMAVPLEHTAGAQWVHPNEGLNAILAML